MGNPVGIVNGLLTLVLMLTFVALVAWAWSARRKRDFAQAAQLPLDEDQPESGPEQRP